MDSRLVGLLFIALLVGLAMPVAAQENRITVDYGETWIRWDWHVNATLTNVYVDGVQKKTNTTQTFYHLVNVNPKELHSVAVYNGSSGELLVQDETMTLISTTILYFWLVVIIALGILLMILSDAKLKITVGVLDIGFIVYDITLAMGHTGFTIVAYALVAFVGYFMVMALYELFREQMKWT
jgi:hypothetical protein